tara:strand:+ start:586 stop:984 length:399 start_codon:yes stop_codon:yes gene_type:complete
MENKETNTDPIPSNEGDYLKLANELKSQFDEEKAKWEAKFIVLEKQNKEMRNFIKRINHVTGEIVKSDNKRLFDEIDEGSNSNPRPRRRRRRIRLVRNDSTEMTETEREFFNFLMHSLENQSEQPVEPVAEI